MCWRIGTRAASFPLGRAALKGFARQEPDQAKDGVTWEELTLIAEHLMDTDRESDTVAAAAALIHYDSYQRPAALLSLAAEPRPGGIRCPEALCIHRVSGHWGPEAL